MDLAAVSRRQAGDVYLSTHVSNLAIMAPLINSLSASPPGERRLADSEGSTGLGSCNSVAPGACSDPAWARKHLIDDGGLFNQINK